MDCGAHITQLRKKAGLSQAQLAEKAGLSLMSIRRYEKGDRIPNIEQLNDIGKVFQESLGIPVGKFISNMYPQINDDLIGAYVQKIQDGEIPTESELLRIVENIDSMFSIRTNLEKQEKIEAINKIIISLGKLNRNGVQESVRRVNELTYLPKYKTIFTEDDDKI